MNHASPGRESRNRSSWWVATIIVSGMILVSGYYLFSRQPIFDTPSVPIEGLPGTEGVAHVAPDLPARTVEGRTLRLGELKGKVVVIDFWATWCAPCRVEIPHLVALTGKYRDKGLEIIGLSIEDPVRDREKVQRFMERFKINYQIGFSSDEIFQAYIGPGDQPIPQTLVFDRQGRVRAHLIGFDPRRDPQRLESLLSSLL